MDSKAEFGKDPLIEDSLVEGCPGCKSSHYQRPGAPLPIKILFIIASLMLCNTLPIQILYPYLYFMVEDFQVEKQKIGTYAGILASSFLVGRVVTSIPWGMIGDKYGRKVVLLGSMASLLVFNTWFGLTKTYAMACTTRFLLGACSGLLATLQAYAAEIVSDEHRPLSLSLLLSMWGVGLVIGPSLGGYLSKPAASFDLFKNTIFDEYPYFLPPLVVSIIGVPVTLLVFCLPETLHTHPKLQDTLLQEANEVPRSESQAQSLLTNYPFWISNILFCFWAFQEMAYNETFSLWAVSPGGLAYSSGNVGSILAVNGAALLLFSIFIYPRVAKRFKPAGIARVGAASLVPVFALYPLVEKLQDFTTSYIFLSVLALLRACLASMGTSSFFLLINNSVTQAQRGTANGINACMVSIARALGPTVGGFIFSLSQSRPNASFLPGNQLLFFFISTFTVIVLLGTCHPGLST